MDTKMKDVKNAIDHLKTHQTFPATKMELVKTCNGLSDFSEDDKRWFEMNLPEGKYDSAEDVIKALGWQDQIKQMSDQEEGAHVRM